jgi:hypothetical protein
MHASPPDRRINNEDERRSISKIQYANLPENIESDLPRLSSSNSVWVYYPTCEAGKKKTRRNESF